MRESEVDMLMAQDVIECVREAPDGIACAHELLGQLDEATLQVRERLSHALSRRLVAEADLADAQAACSLTDEGDERLVEEGLERLKRTRAQVAHERDRLSRITFRHTQAEACLALLTR